MASCTIAIPVRNRKNFIREAVESALAQDADIEVLVIDNCSTDGTWEVLQNYSSPRLRLLRNERDIGLFGNFNRCLDLAKGKYLHFLCSDDLLMPGCLKREIEIMEENDDVVLLSTWGEYMDEQGRSLGQFANYLQPGIYHGAEAIYYYLWFFSHYGYIVLNYPSGILLRLDVAKRAGRFNTQIEIVGDIEFFFRVLLLGNLAILNRIDAKVRRHEGQVGEGDHKVKGTGIVEIYSLIEKYRPLLEQKNAYEATKNSLTALSLGIALRCWFLRQRARSRLHFDLVFARKCHMGRSFLLMLCIIFFRFLLRLTKTSPRFLKSIRRFGINKAVTPC